jgi:hypothetical protein
MGFSSYRSVRLKYLQTIPELTTNSSLIPSARLRSAQPEKRKIQNTIIGRTFYIPHS